MESSDPADERLVVECAGHLPLDHREWVLGPQRRDVHEPFDDLVDTEHRRIVLVVVFRVAIPVSGRDEGVDEHQALDPFGEISRELLRHRRAFGDAEEVGRFPADCVHDREDVSVALLHVGHAVEAVREADAPLVELHAGHVPAELLEVPAVQLVLPRDLDVGDQRRDEDERRSFAPLLVRDPQITGASAMGLGYLHGRDLHTYRSIGALARRLARKLL